jgi:hypothetical protein
MAARTVGAIHASGLGAHADSGDLLNDDTV